MTPGALELDFALHAARPWRGRNLARSRPMVVSLPNIGYAPLTLPVQYFGYLQTPADYIRNVRLPIVIFGVSVGEREIQVRFEPVGRERPFQCVQ